MNYKTVLKGVSVLFLSTVISQVINFLMLPYISREYSEDSLAVMGVMASALVILTIFSTFRLEFYIVKKEKSEYLEFAQSLYLFALISSLILSPILLIYFHYKDITVTYTVIIFSLFYLLASFYLNISTSVMTQRKEFVIQAAIKISRSIILITSLWLFNSLEIIGVFASLSLSVILPLIIYINYRKDDFSGLFSKVLSKVHIVIGQLKNNHHAATQAIFNVLNLQFISFYVIFFESNFLIASYFFMERLINSPLNLLASSVRQVLYKDFVVHKNKVNILLKRMLVYQFILLGIATAVFFAFLFFGEELIHYLLGEKWGSVYDLASIYIFILCFQIINIPTTSMYLTLDKMKIMANYEKADLAIKVLLTAIAFKYKLDFFELLTLLSYYICSYYFCVNIAIYIQLKKIGFSNND